MSSTNSNLIRSLMRRSSIGSFWVVLCLLLWSYAYWFDFQLITWELKQQFEIAQQTRDALLSTLMAEEEGLGEYPRKQLIVEEVLFNHSQELFTKISKLKKLPKKSLEREILNDTKVPFPKDLHLSIGRDGRNRVEFGQNIDQFLFKSWQSQYFRPLHKLNQGTITDNDMKRLMSVTQRVYGIPLNAQRIKERANSVQLIYHFETDQQFYAYFTRKEFKIGDKKTSYQFFYFIPAQSIDKTKLSRELVQARLSTWKPAGMKIGEDDRIQIGDKLIVAEKVNSTEPGLQLKFPKISLLQYIEASPKSFLLTLIPSLFYLLPYLGRLLSQSISGPILLCYSFYLFFLLITVQRVLPLLLQQHKQTLQQDFKTHSRELVRSLEDGFLKQREELSKRRIRDWKDREGQLNGELYRSGFNAISVSPKEKGHQIEISPGVHHIGRNILVVSMSALLATHEDYNGIEPLKEPVWKASPETIKQRIKAIQYRHRMRESQYSIYEKNPESFVRFTLQNPGIYSSAFRGKFSFLQLFEDGYYFVWDSIEEEDQVKFLLISIGGEAIYNNLLKDLDLTALNLESRKELQLELDVFKPSQDKFFTQGSDARYDLFRKYGKKQNQVHLVQIEDKAYWISWVPSRQFQDLLFLFKTPVTPILRSMLEINERFFQFLPWILGLAVLAFFALLWKLVRPLIKIRKGFENIARDNLDFSIKEASKDEIAQLVGDFNSMVQQLRDKKAMMPFVSEATQHLFDHFDEGQTKIEGNGAVVFCDIRSFTTISENHTAEEIVDMLNEYFSMWQPVVERYGGIIDRFIGDAISVVFLETLHTDYLQRAVTVSSEVMRKLPEFNARRAKEGKFTIKNGIGIASSHVTFAIIGTQEKQEFFIHGKAPEVAETLEAESKLGVHSKIIVDNEVYLSTRSSFEYDMFDSPSYPEDQFYELIFSESYQELS